MKITCLLPFLLLAFYITKAQPPVSELDRTEITFETADGLTIFGDLYLSKLGKSAPILLLFHQGGANARAEYGPLIPRIFERGYNILAVDQRQGGSWLGGTNRTVENLDGKEYHYCDAYPDLEAAFQEVERRGFDGKKIIWGSSYSAALAIRFATEYARELAGVLAFSPASGEPMQGCKPDTYFEKVTVPLLVLRPQLEMEREGALKQFQILKEYGHQTYVSENGVHGSSMLNPARVDGSVEEHWDMVLSFLATITE